MPGGSSPSATSAQRSSWRGRRRSDKRRGPLPALLVGAIVLLLWFAVSRSGAIPQILLPDPLRVVERLWLATTKARLLDYAWVTLREAVLGCAGAAAFAIPLAWMLHHWELFRRAVLPYVAASQAVPAIAIAPLLVLWIGYGTVPIVVLCAFMVFFPITVTVLLGLRGLDADVLDAARLDGAHGWTMIIHMEAPMVLPAILAGVRTAFTLSITGAVIGEMVMGGDGMGQLLSSQRDAVDTTGLFATITLLCAMATTVHWLLLAAEHRSRTVAALRGRRAT